MRTLLSFVGNTDLRTGAEGPVVTLMKETGCERAHLLLTPAMQEDIQALKEEIARLERRPEVEYHSLGDIDVVLVSEVLATLRDWTEKHRELLARTELVVNTSSGTPAMTVALLLMLASRELTGKAIHVRDPNKMRPGQDRLVPIPTHHPGFPEVLPTSVPRAIKSVRGVVDVREIMKQVGLAGQSPKLLAAVDDAVKLGATKNPLLLRGESGTGKELFASVVHSASGRRDGILAYNAASLNPSLAGSELFGHRKGAFTGADKSYAGLLVGAGSGTFFLDELNSLPLEVQPMLLRVIERNEVVPVGDTKPCKIYCRFIFATNRDLAKEVEAGRFRHDLYERLRCFSVNIPPLRERPEDIPLLARHFVRTITESEEAEISGDAAKALQNHHWPGNIRELENTLKAIIAKNPGEPVTAELIEKELSLHARPEKAAGVGSIPAGFKLGEHLEQVRSDYLRKAMELADGNKSEAARMLGLAASTFTDWLRKNT